MKILKEEKLEEYQCPKCKAALEFDCNEMKEGGSWKLFFNALFLQETVTGNGWFECSRCNKRYLIKNYANDAKGEVTE